MMILIRLAHLLWEQGVVGSNPATPTEINEADPKEILGGLFVLL